MSQEQPIISKLKQISAKVSTTKMSSQPTIPEPLELVIDGHYDEDDCYCAELDFETIAEVPKENSGMVEIGDEEIPYAKVWNDWVKKDGVEGDIIFRVNDAIYNFIENEVPDLIEMYAKQQFTDYLEDLEKAHTKKQEEETDITDLVCAVLQGGNCDEEEKEVIYYFLKDYELTQTDTPFNPKIHEWETLLEVDGRIEKTYKLKGTDEGGNCVEEEAEGDCLKMWCDEHGQKLWGKVMVDGKEILLKCGGCLEEEE